MGRFASSDVRMRLKIERARWYSFKAAIDLRAFVRLYVKYSDSQPRDAQGRWVWTGSTETDDFTADYASFNGESRPNGAKFRSGSGTGDPEVDAVTTRLEEKVDDILARAGHGNGPIYGTRIHREFSEEIRALGIPRLETEQSWYQVLDKAIYGATGSIRTDVILWNDDERTSIRAVWDLKTGSATLSQSRLDIIRRFLGIDTEVSIIELNVRRGTMVKSIEPGMSGDIFANKFVVALPRLLGSGAWQAAIDAQGFLCPLVLDKDCPLGARVSGKLNGISVCFETAAVIVDRLELAPQIDVAHTFSTPCQGRLEDVAAGLMAVSAYAAACGGYNAVGRTLIPMPNRNFSAHVDGLAAGAFGLEAEWNARYSEMVPETPPKSVFVIDTSGGVRA